MRILLAANDSRGGIQPYLALGVGLRAAGHEVALLAPGDAASMAAPYGITFHALTGSVEEAARAGAGKRPGGGVAAMRHVAREMQGRLETWTREARAAAEGQDLVVGGIGGMLVARAAAELAGIPFVEAHLQPIGASTDRYPGVLYASPPRILGGFGRRLSHRATELALWMPFKRPAAHARRSVLGLDGPFRMQGDGPVLYGFSPAVVPVPDDASRRRIVTGWWFLDAGPWTPPPELERFLEGARPVVSIGFGSMVGEDPRELTALVIGAVRDAGVRAVLLTGWGALDDVTGDDIMVTGSVPHDWLFPRVDAVVHHGGSGTTGAGLRAGVPTVVVPFGVDQPFWGSRVHAIGAGPKPLPRRDLSRDGLAAALRQATTDPAMRGAAARIGAVINGEHGVVAAVRAIETSFAKA
jgi:UDP:flavonoid glycosyltransferase YjiC (YdhE family)